MTAAQTSMAQVASTGAGMTLSDTTIANATVSNYNNSYRILCSEGSSTKGVLVLINGIRITYTVNNPD